MYKLFSTEICPRCKILKEYLNKNNMEYEELDMTTPEAQTELLFHDVFTISAPVLQIGDVFYISSDLFDTKGNLKVEILC